MKKICCTYLCQPSLKQLALLLFLGGVVLVASAFVLEYGFNAIPCRMCWWQRYAHWALTAFALLMLIIPRGRFVALGGVLASAGYGLYVAVYQTLGQYKLVELPPGCGSSGKVSENMADFMAALQNMKPTPACDEVNFTILTFSLAEWNIVAMLAVIVFAGWHGLRLWRAKS